MYFYDVGYQTYEDSDAVVLGHSKKFSRTQLEKMIFAVLPSILDAHIEKDEESKQKLYDHYQQSFVTTGSKSCIVFSDIYEQISDALCKQYGFTKISFATRYHVFGWANLLSKKDWLHERNYDDNLIRLTEMLEKQGYLVEDGEDSF